MTQSMQHLKESIINTLQLQDFKSFKEITHNMQAYDLAQLYVNLYEREQDSFLRLASVQQMADIIAELNNDYQHTILGKMDTDKTSEVIQHMSNDDLINLLTYMDVAEAETLLKSTDKDFARVILNLMKYPPETAGRIMTDQLVWINQKSTVREAVDKLKHFAEIAEYLNYLHVIDNERKLVGVVSYRDLLLAEEDRRINEVMNSRTVTVDAMMDQEDVAQVIQRYNFVTIPVVDEENKLLGIVTVDDILDVVYLEANEDIEKISASGKAIDFNTKPSIAAYRRLTWLVLLLFIGLVSGSIIASFEETLEQVVALAFFMPMIAGMTGNTGTQSLAVVIRGLVASDIDTRQVFKLLIRELWVGVIIGVICGLLIFAIAFMWQGNAIFGFVVAFSLLCTLIIGTLAGTIIPLVLYRLNIDPAIASGPLITTINDILSLLIYFGIATTFLSYLM